MTERELILRGIVEYVPEELARDFTRRDLCVLASRVGHDVGRYFGVHLAPLPTVAAVWNAKALAFRAEHGPPPWDDKVELWEKSGAWVIQIDPHGLEEGRYPAHMILHDAEFGDAFDLSTGQFDRPQHGIVAPQAMALREFELTGCAYEMGDSLIAYTLLDHVGKDYRTAGDWQRPGPYAGRVIRRIKTDLATGRESC